MRLLSTPKSNWYGNPYLRILSLSFGKSVWRRYDSSLAQSAPSGSWCSSLPFPPLGIRPRIEWFAHKRSQFRRRPKVHSVYINTGPLESFSPCNLNHQHLFSPLPDQITDFFRKNHKTFQIRSESIFFSASQPKKKNSSHPPCVFLWFLSQPFWLVSLHCQLWRWILILRPQLRESLEYKRRR